MADRERMLQSTMSAMADPCDDDESGFDDVFNEAVKQWHDDDENDLADLLIKNKERVYAGARKLQQLARTL